MRARLVTRVQGFSVGSAHTCIDGDDILDDRVDAGTDRDAAGKGGDAELGTEAQGPENDEGEELYTDHENEGGWGNGDEADERQRLMGASDDELNDDDDDAQRVRDLEVVEPSSFTPQRPQLIILAQELVEPDVVFDEGDDADRAGDDAEDGILRERGMVPQRVGQGNGNDARVEEYNGPGDGDAQLVVARIVGELGEGRMRGGRGGRGGWVVREGDRSFWFGVHCRNDTTEAKDEAIRKI